MWKYARNEDKGCRSEALGLSPLEARRLKVYGHSLVSGHPCIYCTQVSTLRKMHLNIGMGQEEEAKPTGTDPYVEVLEIWSYARDRNEICGGGAGS